jgi:hypothetical protein
MRPETMVKHYFKLISCAVKEAKIASIAATEARIIGITTVCASFILNLNAYQQSAHKLPI